MKILLTMNLPWYPVHGGANKGNRYLLEGFAQRGHDAMAVVPALGTPSQLTCDQMFAQLAASGIGVAREGAAACFSLNGVRAHAVIDPARLREHLVEQIQSMAPDWVLVSSEDPSQNLLDAALQAAPSRVIYLARTTSLLPFGPQAFFPNPRRSSAFDKVRKIVAVSRFVAEYVRRWTGLDAVVLPLSFFGSGPFPVFGSFDRGFITMVNPCAVKGISIFLALARMLPDVPFAAVPTWGTTAADRSALEQLPNVTILAPSEDIDEILARTRVLLVPSLWAEARARIIVEAMLRGVPVLASDLGGNPETRLPGDLLIPVRPIEHFEEQLDGNLLPISHVPEQDIGPWREALTGLLCSGELYERQSKAVRAASHEFIARMNVGPFEEFLENLERGEQATGVDIEGRSRAGLSEAIARLTPRQRALLSIQVNRRASAKPAADRRSNRIPRVSRDVPLPASYQQQRVWLLDQVNPGSPVYNTHVALSWAGPFRSAGSS